MIEAIIQSTILMKSNLEVDGYKIKAEFSSQVETPGHWINIAEIEFAESGLIDLASIESFCDLDQEEIEVSLRPKTKILYGSKFLMYWEDLQKMSGRYN